MPNKKTHHSKQFKLDAINYRKEHPDLTQVDVLRTLESESALWLVGKHSLERTMVIFLPSVLVATNQKNKAKLPVSNVSYEILRMHLMC